MGWIGLMGFATVVCAIVSLIGQARYRPHFRIAALAAALLCAGFVAGPPFDQVAGGVVMALLALGVLIVLRGG